MTFNSLVFAAFYAIVFALYLLLRKRVTARNLLLLMASYVFYGWWNWRFLSLIVVSTMVDYLVGLGLNVREPGQHRLPTATRRRRLLLLASLVANFGLLGFFKYYGFFAGSLAALLSDCGLDVKLSTLHVILPVGISFYTFQSLSYTIDLYRGQIPTERSLLNFAVYVAFFPQLVAGPIERANRLLPQFRQVRPLCLSMLYMGFYLICVGLFKKVVIADNMAHVSDSVFGSNSFTGIDVLIGVYAFAIQIYCDFSGYTDIARGVAKCMGFELTLNFNLPYFATNPRDFWNRWHISLSTWLRDYLYIPLGGNRRGTVLTHRNLLITMLLGGLWHGAAWRFVAWGAYHGLLLSLHRVLEPWLARWTAFRSASARTAWFWFRLLIFFHLVCAGWLLFRAESLSQAGQMFATLGDLMRNPGGGIKQFIANQLAVGTPQVLNLRLLQTFLACWLAFSAVQLVQWKMADLYFVFRLPVMLRAVVYAMLWLGIILFGEYHGEQFIYFQF